MKKQKTIKDAIKKLPKGTRKSFLDLWNTTGLMDLYDGDLKSYIDTIKSTLTSRDFAVSKLRKTVDEIYETLHK